MHIMLLKPVLNMGRNSEYLEHQKRFTGYYGDMVKRIIGDDTFNALATAQGTTNALLKGELLNLSIYTEPCDDSKVLIEFASLLELRLDAYDKVIYTPCFIEVLPVKNLDAYMDKILTQLCTKELLDKIKSEHSAVIATLNHPTAKVVEEYISTIFYISISEQFNFNVSLLPKVLIDRVRSLAFKQILKIMQEYD